MGSTSFRGGAFALIPGWALRNPASAQPTGLVDMGAARVESTALVSSSGECSDSPEKLGKLSTDEDALEPIVDTRPAVDIGTVDVPPAVDESPPSVEVSAAREVVPAASSDDGVPPPVLVVPPPVVAESMLAEGRD